jgi:hypothetical protein
LKKDGTVWAWGSNSFNQLGSSNKNMIEYPLRVMQLHNIETISAGDMHNLALDNNGKIWAWGVSDDGRLGSANIDIQMIPDVTLLIKDLDEKIKKRAARFADFDQKFTAKSAASLQVYGLDNNESNNRFEIPIDEYIIDTMYHMIQIGDIIVEGCPTAQALKQLSVQLKSDIDGNTHLSWDLSDNDFYYENYFVEKSIDGSHWTELNAKLNIVKHEAWTTFSSIDANQANGKRVFYRLKHLNCDEDFVYSNIISANASADNEDGSFKTKFTVSIDNPNATSVTYQLQDAKGNILKKKILNDKDIAFTDGWDLAAGTYYMFLIDEKLHHIMDAKKLVKVN